MMESHYKFNKFLFHGLTLLFAGSMVLTGCLKKAETSSSAIQSVESIDGSNGAFASVADQAYQAELERVLDKTPSEINRILLPYIEKHVTGEAIAVKGRTIYSIKEHLRQAAEAGTYEEPTLRQILLAEGVDPAALKDRRFIETYYAKLLEEAELVGNLGSYAYFEEDSSEQVPAEEGLDLAGCPENYLAGRGGCIKIYRPKIASCRSGQAVCRTGCCKSNQAGGSKSKQAGGVKVNCRAAVDASTAAAVAGGTCGAAAAACALGAIPTGGLACLSLAACGAAAGATGGAAAAARRIGKC